MSPKRTQKVLEAMEALDYHPDQVARCLRKGGNRVAGCSEGGFRPGAHLLVIEQGHGTDLAGPVATSL